MRSPNAVYDLPMPTARRVFAGCDHERIGQKYSNRFKCSFGQTIHSNIRTNYRNADYEGTNHRAVRWSIGNFHRTWEGSPTTARLIHDRRGNTVLSLKFFGNNMRKYVFQITRWERNNKSNRLVRVLGLRSKCGKRETHRQG